MKTPGFKAAKNFLGDTDLPCLFAKTKNSRLPGVAARYIEEFDDEPCEIYLRGPNPKQVSPWMNGFLQQFFEEERLPEIIAGAMKKYEADPDAYDDCTKEEQKAIRKEGIAAFMTIETIVLDEVAKEAMLICR